MVVFLGDEGSAYRSSVVSLGSFPPPDVEAGPSDRSSTPLAVLPKTSADAGGTQLKAVASFYPTTYLVQV